jgi:NitT/TauT family transport system substrate-binding protein
MPSERLRVAVPAHGAGFAPVHFADEKGLFHHEGVSVTLVALEGGPACARALLCGEVDLTYALGPLVREAMRRGVRGFRAIAGLSKRIGFHVVARPDYTSLKDLRGRTIESPDPDWSGGTYLRYLLSLWGLDREIRLVHHYVTQEERLEALLRGECEAGLLASEKSVIAEQHGFRMILSLDEALPGVASTALLARTDGILERREDLKGVIRALELGIRTLQDSKEVAVAYLTERFTLRRDVALLYHAGSAPHWSIELDPTSVEKEIAICHSVLGLPPIEAKEIVDLSLLQDLGR